MTLHSLTHTIWLFLNQSDFPHIKHDIRHCTSSPIPCYNSLMRILVACERFGLVRSALRELGHDAWSCDLSPAEDGSEYHYQCDVRDVLGLGWGAMIAFPDCTYLCKSGLHWNKRIPGRAEKTEAALDFVRLLLGQDIPKIGLENPMGRITTAIRRWDQVIQPYQFGSDASKATCLWLKGLFPLRPTQYIKPRMVCACGNVYRYEDEFKWGCPKCGAGNAKPRWANQTDSGQNKVSPGPMRGINRARTYPGIAKAMAQQWFGIAK